MGRRELNVPEPICSAITELWNVSSDTEEGAFTREHSGFWKSIADPPIRRSRAHGFTENKRLTQRKERCDRRYKTSSVGTARLGTRAVVRVRMKRR